MGLSRHMPGGCRCCKKCCGRPANTLYVSESYYGTTATLTWAPDIGSPYSGTWQGNSTPFNFAAHIYGSPPGAGQNCLAQTGVILRYRINCWLEGAGNLGGSQITYGAFVTSPRFNCPMGGGFPYQQVYFSLLDGPGYATYTLNSCTPFDLTVNLLFGSFDHAGRNYAFPSGTTLTITE